MLKAMNGLNIVQTDQQQFACPSDTLSDLAIYRCACSNLPEFRKRIDQGKYRRMRRRAAGGFCDFRTKAFSSNSIAGGGRPPPNQRPAATQDRPGSVLGTLMPSVFILSLRVDRGISRARAVRAMLYSLSLRARMMCSQTADLRERSSVDAFLM
jgi:hypothetical protein